MPRARSEPRTDEVLEHTSAFFQEVLWNSEIGGSIRGWLSRWSIGEETLRGFGIGYAPGDSREIFGHLAQRGHEASDLVAAGIASRSRRGGCHSWFHARIVFPVRDLDRRLIGFAGLATHLGPSWPLWLASPRQGPFDPGEAMFGIERASPVIGECKRALIVRDCVEALALHQDGRKETVAVVQSPITRAHIARLSAAMGAGDVHLSRRDGRLGVVAAPPGDWVDDQAFASRSVPNGFALIHSRRKSKSPTPAVRTGPAESSGTFEPRPATRTTVFLLGGLIAAGVPIGLLLIANSGEGAAQGSTPALNLVIVGVAVFYLVVALGVARMTVGVRDSRTRRMRLPWARGSGEVQPAGWTYHRLEEVLVGAALVSAVVCLVLLMTIGGFLG